MNVVYTTTCTMYQVVEENGLYFPQERYVTSTEFGRLRNAEEVKQIAKGPNCITYGPFEGFYGGYKQFSTQYKGDKSFRSLKGAVSFVDRCSENLQEGY